MKCRTKAQYDAKQAKKSEFLAKSAKVAPPQKPIIREPGKEVSRKKLTLADLHAIFYIDKTSGYDRGFTDG